MNTARCADILIREMVALGMRKCFSVSGNQIMAVYDAAIDSGLQIIHTRHEAAAVHMADAWGRLTGEPRCSSRHSSTRICELPDCPLCGQACRISGAAVEWRCGDSH